MTSSMARFRYHGTGGALFRLNLTNSILGMLTLGIYSFWGRTKVREFHYANTEFDGDPFLYHGTGGELLKGALRAFAVMILLVIAVTVLTLLTGGAERTTTSELLTTVLIYGSVALLTPAAINLTRRYRLSRSSWRGVRFSYHGETKEFLKLMIRGTLLSIVTLGMYTPWFESERRAFFVNNVRFGSEPFFYDGNGRELFGDFLKGVLLSVLTLGIYWMWYAAHRHRYHWSHTKMRGAQFVSTATGGDLFSLQLTNTLLVVCTLGIGLPWAITRTQAWWCDNLRLAGTVDWASIQPYAQHTDATGEGLADSLDVDVDFGL